MAMMTTRPPARKVRVYATHTLEPGPAIGNRAHYVATSPSAQIAYTGPAIYRI